MLCVLLYFVGIRVACHFSFLCCVFCFCLWGSVLLIILVFCVVCFVFVCGRSGRWVSCCLFFVCGGSVLPDLPQTKTKHTTQKTKMISNTETPQTKTKHTTQKTKMIGNTDPPQTKKTTHHRKLNDKQHRPPTNKNKTHNTEN